MNDFLLSLKTMLGSVITVTIGAESSAALPRIRLQEISRTPRVYSDDGAYFLRCFFQAGIYSAGGADECEEIARAVCSCAIRLGAVPESVRNADEKGVSGRVIRFYINKEEF